MRILLQLAFFILASTCGYTQAPTITAFPVGSATVAPYSGGTGTTITITGTNFTGTTAVSFGGTPASSFTVVSATTITAVIAGGSTGVVSVTTPQGTANRAGFTYLPFTRLITDFGGYWSSTTSSANGTVPDSSHNMLAFTFNNILYSTGANDAILTAKGLSYTAGSYRAFPVTGITGTNPSSSNIFLSIASKADGNAATGNLAGVASSTIRSVMIDGVRGLDLGTGVTNLPTSAVMTFDLNGINLSAVADAEPDIVITQIADPSVGNDVFQFVDAVGNIVGNSVTQDMTVLTSFGNYKLDLFSFTSGTPYNTANPTAVSSSNGTRGIRMVAFKLLDFGITAGNFGSIKAMKIIPSGNSDYAFIAYNTNAISAAPNISQNIANTINNVCSTGNAVLAVIGTASSGGSLSFSWERSTDGGNTWLSITDGGNFSGATTNTLTVANPVNNDKFRSTVAETGSAVTNTCSAFTLTVSVPSVGGIVSGGATVCAGTNSTALTLIGQTGSIVRWESSINNFTTISSIANTTGTITAANLSSTAQYRAVVQNGACVSINSAPATVTVNPVSVGGTISGSTAVCTGTNSTLLTLSGQTGNVVRWESSVNNFTTNTPVTNTTTNLTATNLAVTTQYRAVVQNGVCATAYSSVITITYNTPGQWIGGVSGNWNVASNWCGGIPTASTNVFIPSTATVTISYGNALANTINITTGGSLVMSDTANLLITAGGSFSNNGTFDATATTTGKISFLGAGTISGTTGFQNIQTYGALNFGAASSIAGEFTLQAGGSVTANAPTYLCPAATLIYNTGGTFARSLEWPSVSSGKGFPSNVSVKNATVINFPAAGAGFICNDLLIESGSALYQNYSGASAALSVGRHVIINGTITLGSSSGGDISLSGNWTRNSGGIFNPNGRKVIFSGTLNSVITAPAAILRDSHGAFGGETFYDINIQKATATHQVQLASNISIINELKLSIGIFDLVNSDITLVSDTAGTAHVAAIPSSGTSLRYGGTGGTGAGKFIVQRHLKIGPSSASRRWRFLSAPLQSTAAPTINGAWQSGVSNSDRTNPVDPWPGFGTTITKSTVYNAADGYDVGSTNNPSIYYLDHGAWAVLPSTRVPITDHDAYMLFVRGNRSIVVSTPNINANSTTLEPKGKIYTGDVQKTVKTGNNPIGNPYPSSIRFSDLLFNQYASGGDIFNNVTPGSAAGIGITYYLWDPKTTGTSGVGKWITLSSNGNGTYCVTGNTSGLPGDGTIESGAAFMIKADSSGGTLTFHETDKTTASGNIGVASRAAGDNVSFASLSTTLLAGSNSDAPIADGVINSYNSAYRNSVDGQDAPAMTTLNSGEILRIKSKGQFLSIERRNSVAKQDTIFLHVQYLAQKTYNFLFTPLHMDPAIPAFLEDSFTGMSRPVSMTAKTLLSFQVTADERSSRSDRFRIIFKNRKNAPLVQNLLTASPKKDHIAVQWTIEQAQTFSQSSIEKSVNGRNFFRVNSVLSQSHNKIVAGGQWLDIDGIPGDNFYRIKNTRPDGSVVYSDTVKVVLDNHKARVTVFPNPVTDGTIRLQLTNMPAGDYTLLLNNTEGQTIHWGTIRHSKGSTAATIQPIASLRNGYYHLVVSGPAGTHQQVPVLMQKND